MCDTKKLYRVKRTLAEMLHDRGYKVPKEELEFTEEAFVQRYGEQPDRANLTDAYTKTDLPDQIWVFFAKEPKVRVQEIQDFYKRMKADNISRAIVVFQTAITPFARQSMSKLVATQVIMEQFKDDELLVNITKHTLVPKHIPLSAEDKNNLLMKYKLKETQLPRIQHNDAVARYLGLQRGQVVQIMRSSETAGRYVTYRYVV